MDPLVILTFLVVFVLELSIPLLFASYLRKKLNVSWRVFAYGALFFILVQVLHIPLVLYLQPSVLDYLIGMGLDETSMIAVLAVLLGLLAGIFEEVGRFLVYKYFFPPRKIDQSRGNGLMFGAGWGGVESMFVGVLIFLTMISYLFAAPLTDQRIQSINQSVRGTLTEQDVQALNEQNEALMNLTPVDVLPGLFERVMTITLHIAWSLLVLAAVVNRKNSLLILAIVWHAATDALAVFLGQTSGVLAAEGAIFILALIGLWYIREEWRAMKQAPVQ